DFHTLESSLIMRYHDHAWRPVDDPLPIAFLDDISMTSPDDGWVTGFSQDKRQSYLLRYTAGHWQEIAVPWQPTGGKFYGGIRMLSPDEGWIVVNSASGWRGQIESLLLHYRHGAWTPVAVPTPVVWDFTPVGTDDLWLIGNASTLSSHRKDSVIAHFQQGQWNTTPAPGHALLGTLRMQSAAAGYATGWQPYTTGPLQPPAVVLQYDGTTWNPIQKGADPAAQEIVLFDQTDAWAFVKTHPEPTDPPLPNDVISRVQHTTSAIDLPWQAVDWPFTDIISIHSMVRAAPGEYWAAAHYQVPPGAEGDFHWELLHFADGAWHEYPPR
ncbi:MAG TPA: hypothetical protein VJO13_13175, partial [Ktedonobacterales bacterium]|nr:hypothetical protein [Ktedonobacterales bacterium]